MQQPIAWSSGRPDRPRWRIASVRLLVLADTHLRADLSKLPPEVWDELDACDAVLHAGDVMTGDLLDALRERRPVHAVLGNNDTALVGLLPDRIELELAGVRLAMVHDSGARTGRERRMRRWFPDADIVVFGHSHIPVDAESEDGQRLFNPGSAVQRRRQPQRTMGVLELADGAVVRHEIVPLT
ncbi:MAG: metallophosphoesterase family protein [Acidimicrobiales bacterium]|nr:metallophosphoesterase family protein [Acidimicrobiales bacterium]